MSDSLPLVALPEDADPENENWKGIDLSQKEPVLPLYAHEEQKLFNLPDGYDINPVLTEPQIEQPGAIAFDGNGRMYVLELRTYMLTADSDGTLEPVSRISRWEDVDNDGTYEKGTVFVDSLIFPRFVLPYGKDCILAMESDADNVYKYTDTNGDGKADKKEFFTNKYGRSGNVEHQQAFMYWGMDNWLYSTVNAFRVRETSSGVIRENTGYNRAQWGVTHDDSGKLWFQGGASGLPSYFQFPIHYGNFVVEDQFAEGFDIPWGAAVKIGDMQGGMDEIRQPDGSLNRVTGSAGNDIFRGDRLPKNIYGQYFYGEPVARIVRQVNPVVSEGLTQLHNVYQDRKTEFLTSTDPLFRPVDMTTAPDGTLYITDMYHGIIQEGQWAQKGSYLRTKIEQYQLDKVIGLGRIWRITHKDFERNTQKPNMFNETPKELVAHLAHPNGWWRDKAQQLLVLTQDRSVIPELENMAKSHSSQQARIHALWALDGLNGITKKLISTLLNDHDPKIKIQALRAAEPLYKRGETSLATPIAMLLNDQSTDVVLQAILTVSYLKLPEWEKELQKVKSNHSAKGVQLVITQIFDKPKIRGFGTRNETQLTTAQKNNLEKGAQIFNELCAQCHGIDGTGTPVGNGQTLAPALTGSIRVQSHPDYTVKTILYGLQGPLDGKDFPGGIMVGNMEQNDEWIASIASYIRTQLMNEASFISPEKVAQIRAENADRSKPFSFEELLATIPQILEPQPQWKVTASHNAPNRIGGKASTLSAFNLEGWTTGEAQAQGMWFQIELPTPTQISEIHLVHPPKWQGPNKPFLQTYPKIFEVLTSLDGQNWNARAQIESTHSNLIIDLQKVKTKFIKLHVVNPNEEDEKPREWTIREMRLYGMKE
jgi:mono/diheme cytochrome c family protein